MFSSEHCIELIRQSLVCRADTALITFHWGDTVKLPQPDTTLLHKCVDWDYLMGRTEQHRINLFEEGMMVHPVFGKYLFLNSAMSPECLQSKMHDPGPSYPGGFRDDRSPPNPAEVDPE